MHHPHRGLAITDLLAIGAILVLIAALGVPTLERARELSKRTVCAVNLKALGGAGFVYADANKGQWMTPPFKERAINQDGIVYLCNNGFADPYNEIACVGFGRDRSSGSETPSDPAAGSTALGVTRAYWMLVRSGNISAKQFICPSNQVDSPDSTEQIDLYYDFEDYRNISYGYLVPFGPIETRPRNGRDHRMIFAADKGPYYVNILLDPYTAGPNGTVLQLGHDPSFWRRFNSPNHGGIGNGEGQNALFADGRVEFHRIPAIGVDNDNIYTLMIDEWAYPPLNRIHGDSPHRAAYPNPYPGKGAFGRCQLLLDYRFGHLPVRNPMTMRALQRRSRDSNAVLHELTHVAPDGAKAGSHGWSEAEPVVADRILNPRPEAGGGAAKPITPPGSMRERARGLALADLLACGAVLVVVAAIGVPTLERARELSKRMTCSVNLKGIGLAGAAYAESNSGEWMTPSFKQSLPPKKGLAYLCYGNNTFDYPCVGFDRHRQSETDTEPSGGSAALSTTRAYWMLVRSGDISIKQFICPSSIHDQPDPTELIELYYDFSQYQNISYGYLVPFGPPETRPRQGRDSRVVFAADKGPFYSDSYRADPYSAAPGSQPLQLNHQPRYWQAFNSPNHGGLRFSDGQNAMFADGRVEFHRNPAFGADHDNIYTLIPNVWDLNQYNLIHGETPHQAAYVNPYPGQGTLDFKDGPGSDSTTDSLIYP